MPRPAYVWLYAVVLFVGYAGWLLFTTADPWTVKVVIGVESILVVAVGGILAALAARSARGRVRAAWVVLAIGFAGATVGESLWSYQKLWLRQSAWPTLADPAYLMFPVALCVALLMFPVGRIRRSQSRLVLDGVVLAGSLLIVSWLTVMGPKYQSDGARGLDLLVSFAFPVSNMVALTVAAVVLAMAGRGPRRMLTLMTVGLASMTIVESAFAYVNVDSAFAGHGHYLFDIFWTLGILLITIGVAEGARASFVEQIGDEMPGWVSVWLPFVPLVLAGLAIAAEQPDTLKSGPVLVVGLVLLLAVLARQYLAVNEDRQLLAQLSQQSRHDPLTGLANRVRFDERLRQALRMPGRPGRQVGVLAIDLNDFKLVNDALGHSAGDELLIAVADRLRGCVGEDDAIARLGGDEFAVLIEGVSDDARRVAERIVGSFDQPFLVEGQELLIRPSVGLAVAEPDSAGQSAEELLKRADSAMYVGKRSGFAGVQVFSEAEEPAAGLIAERLLLGGPQDAAAGAAAVRTLAELRDGITNSALALRYQPKFSLRTGEWVGVEALLRWDHPSRGSLGPEEFLPLIREHTLMTPVNDFVINRALDDMARWRSGGGAVPLAVNVWAPMLADPKFPSRLIRALDERGLDPTQITVEITEDVLLASLESTKTVLNQLRQCGVRIAVDDFGSGYSALSYLRELAIDEIKLDRGFIAPISGDTRAAAVVRAVLDLAHELDLTTVAEGVEDEETVSRLRQYRCDVVQGYLFSLPLTAEEIQSLPRQAPTWPAPASARSS